MGELEVFFQRAAADPRLGPLHVSVFVSLLVLWERQLRKSPLLIVRRQVMELAKIASSNSYHRVIRDLSAFGYLSYEGRRDRKGSSVYF